jgi:hypothetical protein
VIPEVSLSYIFNIIWQLIKNWWWLPLPFLLWDPFKYLWRWWRVDIWMATVYKPILLEIKIPKEIQGLIDEREKARKNKDYKKSDEIRNKIKELGFEIQDTKEKIKVRKI